MKKIININLSGRVIPIEDSAYESLQRYIESLRKYFAKEEGRDEIINDIESRIAELMNDKVRKGAFAITDEDMEEIISSMGRIEDFERAEAFEAAEASGNQGTYSEYTDRPRPRGRLYRDANDKILGGVCSGIGNYLNIDPAIIRILLVLLIFGAGTGILIYILLWIILPIRPLEGTTSKRLFRNPDDRILGGVAGGIAAYFNKDTWMIRLIFAAPLLLNILFGILNGLFFFWNRDVFPNFFIGSFTGTFIITYIILWIILPEAKTTYEKMEMRGEKVDVNRIRQNVQEGMGDVKNRAQAWGEEVKNSAQNISNQAKQFAETRGKAFASEAAQAARPIANSVGHVIGVLFKIFLLFILGSIAFAFFMFLIAFVFSGAAEVAKDFFLDGFSQKFLTWTSILLFFGVPLIALITWIIRRLMKVRTANRYLGWTFGGLWVLGIISTILLVASIMKDFRHYNKSAQEVPVAQAINKMVVTVNEPELEYSGTYNWIEFDGNDRRGWDITNDSLKLSNIKLRVDKSDDSNYHVTVWRYSAGENRNAAANRARLISYSASAIDSNLLLSSGFGVAKAQKFRGQKVLVEIKVPVGKQIRFSNSVDDKFNPYEVRRTYRGRWRNRDWDIDWDRDMYFDWKTETDYTMSASGELEETNRASTSSTIDWVERYRDSVKAAAQKDDSVKKVIQQKIIQNEEERKKLQELLNRKTGMNHKGKNYTYVAASVSPFIPLVI